VSRRPAPADLRLLPPALAGWCAAWFGLALPLSATIAGAGAFLLLGVFGLARSRSRIQGHPLDLEPAYVSVCTAMLVGAGFAASCALHLMAAEAGPVPDLARHSAVVGAMLTVTGDPRRIVSSRGQSSHAQSGRPVPVWQQQQDLLLIPARMIELRDSDGTVAVRSLVTLFVYVDKHPRAADQLWLDLLPSTEIAVRGKLVPAQPGTEEVAELRANGPPTVLAGPSIQQRTSGALRADLRAAVAGLPAEPAGLLPALAVGDTSQEPPELAAAFKATGLTFLTVASGENLVFVAIALLPVVRWAGLRGRAVPLAGAALALGFTAVARPGPPMVRATVMALFACGAKLTGRRFRALPVMAAAVLVLLWYDPWLAHAYGFVLSVAATAGLLVVAPGWYERLADRGVPRWIAGAAAATAAAELFCEPLLVTFTGQLPLLAVLCNIAAVPAAPVATVLGVLAMVGAAVWLPLGQAIAWLGQWPVRWICLVAKTGAAAPGAVLPWPRGALGGALLLTAYLVVGILRSTEFRQNVTKSGLDKQEARSI
jgi:competence protein ComEC